MLNKYELRSFPECFQLDDSDIETEQLKTTLKLKKQTYVKPKKFFNKINKPECIFTDEKKNISFYQSDSNSSYKERNFHSLNQKTFNSNYDSYIMNRKSSAKTNYVTEQFSYNYINTNDSNENINRSNAPYNQRISVDTFLSQKLNKAPKRTIKTYLTKFDVEKSDNFNVLSYRPEEYESDFIKTNSKSKIGQIFKREDIKEIYNSNKHSKSPFSHPSSNTSSHIKVKRLKYQTPNLQSQSFCGSYIRPKQTKKIIQTKSNTKITKNQLEDFNIDKLIEIGDNCSNKWTNFLSFGKKINNIKQKNKYNQLRQRNHDKRENLTQILQYSPKKKEIEENIKNYNDSHDKNKNEMTKSIIYHGNIKSKKNINKNKKINKLIKNINNLNKNKEDINKTLNINDEKKVLDMNYINLNMNDIYFKKANSNNNDSNINSTNNNTIKSKKINSMLYSMDNESFDNKNKGENIYTQITPKKSIHKKSNVLFFKNKNNYSIDSFKNIDKNIENNESKINDNKNNVIMIGEKSIQPVLPKKFLIKTETNSKVNSKKIMQKSKPIIKKAKIVQLKNNREKLNKKVIKNIPNAKNATVDNNNINNTNNINSTNNTNNTNNVNNNQNVKKNEGIKAKNYYGFDERHNLEGIINNHTYHISIYSRKKVNPKNMCIETIK